MVNNIKIGTLRDLSTEEFKGQVIKLAKKITAGRTLVHQVSKDDGCILKVTKKKDFPSLDVVEDLNAILKRAIEIKEEGSLAKRLAIIRSFRDRILAANPVKTDFLTTLIDDPFREIFSHFSLVKNIRISATSKRFYLQVAAEQIKFINENRIPVQQFLISPEVKRRLLSPWKLREYVSVTKALDWLLSNPACKELTYADFSHCRNFDNECLKKLTEHCPKLTYLNLNGCGISGDALDHLKNTPQLLSLNVRECQNLNPDALKNLEKTPKLRKLNIYGCNQLESDALKHLRHIPGLLRLNMAMCNQFETYALKHLEHTTGLQHLHMGWCDQLGPDSLQILENIPRLLSLKMPKTNRKGDELKYLKYTPQLQILDISCCDKLEIDALKHLAHTPELQWLCITNCSGLRADSLRHLANISKLTYLAMQYCPQIEPDALKYLVHTPKLYSLFIYGSSLLEADALKHLVHTPKLKEINFDRHINRRLLPPRGISHVEISD